MTRIGLLSDTHALWDEKYLEYFESCDEISCRRYQFGKVAEKLAAFRPLRAVYGNIDGQEIPEDVPAGEPLHGGRERVLIKHIGGYPGNTTPSVIGSLMASAETFISGHPAYIKVKYDKTLDMLHINPRAAGCPVSAKVRTMGALCHRQRNVPKTSVIELAG